MIVGKTDVTVTSLGAELANQVDMIVQYILLKS